MKQITLCLLLLLFIHLHTVDAQNYGKVNTVKAIRIKQPITIDGKLTEPVWKIAPSITKFTERDPVEGSKPTEKTVVHILYDNNAIYIGARLYDNHPDSIVAQLGRRDTRFKSDNFVVYLDPYHDKQTGYYFAVNAGGTIYDGTLYNDVSRDKSWDGVWQGKSHRDDKGWTVEMRIPYSQLRFHEKKKYIWGIDFKRDIGRNNEKDYLVYTPKDGNGFVSLFPNLTGITNIKPKQDLEVLPYITSKAAYSPATVGDPFNNGSNYNYNAGADVRTTIASNLSLDATINPDFGQVEVDPAVVNLSDVETFFPEKRPFFIQGRNFFNYGLGGVSSHMSFNWHSPNFFYSRRIGRKPRGSVPDNNYVDYPSGTHIIGAAKITGQLNGNWNIGALQAVTSVENASYYVNNKINKVRVAPISYYGVARVQKQFNNAMQSIGILTTLTKRDFKTNYMPDQLNKSALVTGVDGWTFLDSDKVWVVSGWAGMSHIAGTQKRMLDIQTDPIHYLQRPEFKNNGVDSSLTSLTGYAGRIMLAKQKGQLSVNTAFGFIDPHFDINDLGYMTTGNVINTHIAIGYKWTELTSWYRYLSVGAAYARSYDFQGNHTGGGIMQYGHITFPNYYWMHWNVFAQPTYNVDNRLTRGGPLALGTPGISYGIGLGSDSRKIVVLTAGIHIFSFKSGSHGIGMNTNLEIKPKSNVSVSIGPGFNRNVVNTQWVGKFIDPYAIATFGKRYVFAEMTQHTLSANMRVNWTFTPRLSLQLFAQPLISSGNYYNYKMLEKPKTYDFLTFGNNNSTIDNKNNIADPDGSGPAAAINLGNPNYNFRSLRGNAVLRWEYRPGSRIYFVWTQSRTDSQDIGTFNINNAFTRLINAKPSNIFLVKFSYWFNV